MKTIFLKTSRENHSPQVFKLSFVGLLILLLFFQSCKQDKEDQEVVPSVSGNNDNQRLVQFLVEQGFHEDDISYNDTVFSIDGDIKIRRKDLEDHYQAFNKNSNSKITQRKYEILVNDSYIGNIKVYIQPVVPSDWASALRTAFSKWNNTVLATKIRFVETANSAEANISVGTYYEDNNIIAWAYFPLYDGRPGDKLMINTKFNFLSANWKITSMMHELGHNIGLSHTDQVNSYDFHIHGTATSDSKSVMNSSSGDAGDFTHNDIRAAQILYPAGGRNSRLMPIYRYYRAPHHAHFYTPNFTELRSTYFEHIECFVWDHQASGSVPIYRYYNSTINKHMYTTNWNELGTGKHGYVYEGIIGYGYTSQLSGTVPIYRYYNHTTGNHYFSQSSVTPAGYISEGIGWFAFQ